MSTTSRNAQRLRGMLLRALGALSLLFLSGCGDNADNILRTSINLKNEHTDRLMQVKDEASATRFIEVDHKIFMERARKVSDKWQKLIRDIEDENRGKKVIVFTSRHPPGSAKWQDDAQAALKKDIEKEKSTIANTRQAFSTYVANVTADQARVDIEKKRIKGIINASTKGNKRAAEKEFPNLSKLLQPETYGGALVAGTY